TSYRRAKGSTPRARSRSSFWRRAATASASLPWASSCSESAASLPASPSSGDSFIADRVPLEDEPEPFEREPRLVVVHRGAVGDDELGQAAGGDDRGLPELLGDPFDHPVHHRG